MATKPYHKKRTDRNGLVRFRVPKQTLTALYDLKRSLQSGDKRKSHKAPKARTAS